MNSEQKARSWRWTRAHAIPVVWEGEGNYVVTAVDGQLGWTRTGDGAALGAMLLREQDLQPVEPEQEERERRAELNQGLSPDDPRYLDAQFTEQDRDAMDEWESEAGLRRAELGQEEWGGPEDPRERDADYAYMDLLASLPVPPSAATVLAAWDAEDAGLQHALDVQLRAAAEKARGLDAEAKLRASGFQLGFIAGKVYASRRAEAECYEEADLFGAPSEVAGLIAGSFALERAVLLTAAGLTAKEFNALLQLRGDAKQCWALGLFLDEED